MRAVIGILKAVTDSLKVNLGNDLSVFTWAMSADPIIFVLPDLVSQCGNFVVRRQCE